VVATRQLRPDHIALAASGHTIYIDRSDRRGRGIIEGLGRGHQPSMIALWRQLIETASPTLVIDVGANYGELILNARYPDGVRALAIEANARIVPLLRRAISEHPDQERIELHDVLAGDVDHGSDHLRIDPSWSGSAGTSLDDTQDGGDLVELTVPVRTLDALVGVDPRRTGGPLLVKIDTEGSEAQVLGGMTELLNDTPSLAMLIEFAPNHLQRQGTDPAALFATLQGRGPCWSIDWAGAIVAVHEVPSEPRDILVVSDPELARELGLPGA
jgi:FkbM family methyltransferase